MYYCVCISEWSKESLGYTSSLSKIWCFERGFAFLRRDPEPAATLFLPTWSLKDSITMNDGLIYRTPICCTLQLLVTFCTSKKHGIRQNTKTYKRTILFSDIHLLSQCSSKSCQPSYTLTFVSTSSYTTIEQKPKSATILLRLNLLQFNAKTHFGAEYCIKVEQNTKKRIFLALVLIPDLPFYPLLDCTTPST